MRWNQFHFNTYDLRWYQRCHPQQQLQHAHATTTCTPTTIVHQFHPSPSEPSLHQSSSSSQQLQGCPSAAVPPPSSQIRHRASSTVAVPCNSVLIAPSTSRNHHHKSSRQSHLENGACERAISLRRYTTTTAYNNASSIGGGDLIDLTSLTRQKCASSPSLKPKSLGTETGDSAKGCSEVSSTADADSKMLSEEVFWLFIRSWLFHNIFVNENFQKPNTINE